MSDRALTGKVRLMTETMQGLLLPEGAPAWLVEKTGPVVQPYKEHTLAEARAREDL